MIEWREPIQNQLAIISYIVKTIKVDWNSRRDAYMHVFTDVTSVKNYEKEKALNECLYILFSSMSHEFRTPLNTVWNSISLLASKIEQMSLIVKNHINEDNKDYKTVSQISEACNKYKAMANISSKILTNSIENILDLAKVEARNLDLNMTNFSIKSIVEEIKFIFEDQWNRKQLYFQVNCSETVLGSHFTSDFNRIKQILINLVSNSFKFTDRGGIAIFIDRITKRNLDYIKEFVKFKVSDTGIGISNDDQKQIF